MRLTTINYKTIEQAAIVEEGQYIPISSINSIENKQWSEDLYSILQNDQLNEIINWYQNGGSTKLKNVPKIDKKDISISALYRNPRKIWGVGMNYMEKAAEFSDIPTDLEPIIFMKPDSSLIGSEEAIILPSQSEKVTGEAELAIIIGKECKNISEKDAEAVIAGYVPSLDMTAADIHSKNPRYLQRSKSFDTFFSFGPELITKDELDNVQSITVETVLNNEVVHRNCVANMMFQPSYIVSFFSKLMTLYPGDIIMTGTPGSVVLSEGDVLECRIAGFEALVNTIKL